MFDHFKLIVIAFAIFAFLWLLSHVKEGTKKKSDTADKAEAKRVTNRDKDREESDDLDEFEDE